MYVKWRTPRRKVRNVMRNTRRPKQDTVVVMRASKGAGGFVGGYYDKAQWYAPNISEYYKVACWINGFGGSRVQEKTVKPQRLKYELAEKLQILCSRGADLSG